MNIVLFGCQQIAVDIINDIVYREDIELSLVVTYELPLDETYGYESVLNFCKEKNINVIDPKSVTEDLVRQVKTLEPDIIFSVYYRQVLPSSLIDLPKLGCVNIHPSELPMYRGPVPTAWAIENGEETFGITIHQMDYGIDTGDILVQEIYEIREDETGFELYTRAMQLGAKLLIDNLDDILNKKIIPIPQTGMGSYFGKKDGKYLIDWKKSMKEIRNMIRVHASPYNPAETLLFNRYVLINKVNEHNLEGYTAQNAGKIIEIVDGDKIVVSCNDGLLLIVDYEIVPKLTNDEERIYLKAGNTFG